MIGSDDAGATSFNCPMGAGTGGGGVVISAANGRQMVLAAAHPINTDTWNHFRESAASGVACQLASPGVANSLEKKGLQQQK